MVKQWLVDYKFKYWDNHSDGRPVTHDDKLSRATEIAKELCDHSKWLTHGRSIKIDDLEKMRLKIINYSKIPDLDDAITRYYSLLRISFDVANMYKIFETTEAQVMRFIATAAPAPAGGSAPNGTPQQQVANCAIMRFECPNCKKSSEIQMNLDISQPLQPGKLAYPIDNNQFTCPYCSHESNLSPIRLQLEAQSGRKVVA